MTERQRCRGDNHKPNCAHLGLDPTRLRCQGDKHRMACEHLNPTPKTGGRPPIDRRSAGQSRRWQAERDKAELGRVNDLAIARDAGVAASESITHKTPPLTRPYRGTAGPIHDQFTDSSRTPCLCGCHYREDCEHRDWCAA